MSSIGELAYQLLLGWVRALFDWGWALFSGQGGGASWQWFLSNWKVWLVTLLIIGLVADWIMWMVRWRPYRLLFGRLGRVPRGEEELAAAQDGQTFYYDEQADMEAMPVDWTDRSFGTLSEVDPNWVSDMAYGPEGDAYYENPDDAPAYDLDVYDAPPAPGSAYGAYQQSGYWDETPDELETYDPEPMPMEGAAQADVSAYEESLPGDTRAFKPEPPPSEAEPAVQYGRPTLWPGGLTFAGQTDESPGDTFADEANDADAYEEAPMENPAAYAEEAPPAQTAGAQSRRRRSLRGDAGELRRYEVIPDPPEAEAPPADVRPERLVRPAPPTPTVAGGEVLTVTGKPAKRRGIMRFASTEEDPIAGLPPMDAPPSMPRAEPGSPDFEDDMV